MRPLLLAVLLLFSGTQESVSLYMMSIVLNIMISPDDGVGSYKPIQNGTDITPPLNIGSRFLRDCG